MISIYHGSKSPRPSFCSRVITEVTYVLITFPVSEQYGRAHRFLAAIPLKLLPDSGCWACTNAYVRMCPDVYRVCDLAANHHRRTAVVSTRGISFRNLPAWDCPQRVSCSKSVDKSFIYCKHVNIIRFASDGTVHNESYVQNIPLLPPCSVLLVCTTLKCVCVCVAEHSPLSPTARYELLNVTSMPLENVNVRRDKQVIKRVSKTECSFLKENKFLRSSAVRTTKAMSYGLK